MTRAKIFVLFTVTSSDVGYTSDGHTVGTQSIAVG